MPFDLELAHFTLDANDQGGIMTISTDSEFRADEIQRVREYLREVQQEFRAGNFEDPETIQGADTPGLAKLAAGAEDLQIAYVDLPDGGRLILRSDRPDLVDAVHRWFDAMLVDFGDRASVPTTRPEPSEDGPPVPDGLLG